MSEDRIVVMRTSASANDFWARLRPADAVGADGKVIAKLAAGSPSDGIDIDDVEKEESGLGQRLLAFRALTPFGRQKHPFMARRNALPLDVLRDSRQVELFLLRQELEHAEAAPGEEVDMRKLAVGLASQ